MEASNLPVWMFFLLLGAMVLIALVVGARLIGQQPRVSPDHHHTSTRKRNRTPLVIGPSEVIVVGPSEASSLVIGPSKPLLVGPSPQEIPIVGPAAKRPVVIGPPEPLVVEPPPRGVWDDRGWMLYSENGRKVYEGYYRVTHRRTGQPRRFRGRIIVNRKGAVPYIADPPAEIRRHPKGPCFMLVNAPWFRVNWSRPARNVDDAILYVEKVLDEALNGR